MSTSTLNAALDLLSGLVLENEQRWGQCAVDFQWEDAEAVLDPESSTPYHFVTRARGGAKTSDLAGTAIVAMLAQLPPGSRLYGLAADRDQGRLLIDSIQGYATRTPELRGALDVQAYRVAATRSGSLLEVIAADAPGAWGLRPYFMIVDEICQWGSTPSARRLWEAASTAIAKTNGRMVVLTTAGDPSHWSRKILDHALEDPLWRVHEVHGPPPWMDEERIAEQRRRLMESSFLRLFMNEWVSSEDRLTSEADLLACVTLDGPIAPEPGQRYVIGVDVGLKNDRTVCAVCHAERSVNLDGQTTGTKVTLDRLQVWAGTSAKPVQLSEVEAWLGEAATAYRGAAVRIDPWQAIGSLQRLRSRGVRVEEFTFSASSVGRLASTLHLLLKNHQLALPDDDELLDELRNVRLRESAPGVVRLDHDADGHDDRAIALALAASKLLDSPSGLGDANYHWDPVTMSTPGGVGVSGTFGYGDEF